MIRWFYDLGFLIFGLAVLPHFLMRLGQAENPRELLGERFGFISDEKKSRLKGRACLWIHGVSVGEILALEKFIRLILERKPDFHIVLTTVTPTGQRMAKRWEGERLSVLYFPFDFQFAVGKFFDALRPSALLLVETEIWPNVLREARRRRVPVGIVNGRISERSFRAFRRFSFLFRPLLEKIDFFLVQTDKDEKHLLDLGIAPAKVAVTGNMKLDAFELNGEAEISADLLRKKWGFLAKDRILIGGSTHEGEEEILLRILRRLREEGFSAVKLLIAPRHIERSEKVLNLVQQQGFHGILATRRGAPCGRPKSGIENPGQAQGLPLQFDVLILDQLGELRKLYALADVVFMGGSLIRHGGQNPIEPAAVSRPIFHGPWVFNFHEIYRRLDDEGASFPVKNEEELFFGLKRLLVSDREREYLGKRAYEVLNALRGASERNYNRIHSLIEKESHESVHAR